MPVFVFLPSLCSGLERKIATGSNRYNKQPLPTDDEAFTDAEIYMRGFVERKSLQEMKEKHKYTVFRVGIVVEEGKLYLCQRSWANTKNCYCRYFILSLQYAFPLRYT